MYSHGRFTKMLDGRIAALHWTQQVGSGEDLDLHLTTSDLSGTTWTDPAPTGIAGQTSWLADLGDGVLAAAYTSRAGRNPGIMMVLSEDEGRSGTPTTSSRYGTPSARSSSGWHGNPTIPPATTTSPMANRILHACRAAS